MRPVYLSDLDAATRALLAVPEPHWEAVALDLLAAADVADRYRKRFGRAHVQYGTGTLTSAVSGAPRARVAHCDARYRAALAALLAAFTHQSA